MTSAADIRASETRRIASQRVWATSEAVEAIVRLRARHGKLILRHIGGEEGTPEVRLVHDCIPRDPDDLALGTVGGSLFMIDRKHDLELGCPDFNIDVTPSCRDEDHVCAGTERCLVSRAVR